MMNVIPARWRQPLFRTLAGLLLAVAWAIGRYPDRWLAIVIAICALAQGLGRYVWAGADTDEGALLGSRADERQKLVNQQAFALAGKIALASAYVGLLVTVAVKRADAWPFLVMFVATAFGYLLGLSNYGSGEAADEDLPAAHGTRSPVSQ
jgi:hypothetical protein